jgi:hypothetical protein
MENMQEPFYSKTKPDLIGYKTKISIDKIIENAKPKITISDKISQFVSNITTTYTAPNLFYITIFMLVLSFLIFRYSRKKENYANLSDIQNQTNRLRYQEQPTIDILKPVNKQYNEIVNYPPEDLPININDDIIYTKDLYERNYQHDDIGTPNYDFDVVYKSPTRSSYAGQYDSYQNAEDTDTINPLGFSNEFNTTSGNFISGMTDLNRHNIQNYGELLSDNNNYLYDSLDSNNPQ